MNPSLAGSARLTWCFEFAFEEVTQDGGPLGLTVEWLPVPTSSWHRMAGLHLTSPHFAQPAEASVYAHAHHRFDMIDLALVQQQGPSLRAITTVSVDLDGLGVDRVHADAWLMLAGILVSLPDAASPDEALTRLGEFTDTAGLVFQAGRTTSALRFIPRTS